MRTSQSPQAFAGSRVFLAGAFLFSCLVNMLALSAPIFMIEVYDRVIPSKSVPTLVALLVLVAGLYAFSGLLDVLRGRVMTRIAAAIDATLTHRVFAVVSGAALRTRMTGDVLKPAQDLEQIRSFLGSNGPVALFDLPWMPVYLVVCYFMHPLIGLVAAGAMLILAGMTLLTNMLTRAVTTQSSLALAKRNRFGEAASRNGEALAAMGMQAMAARRWDEAQTKYIGLQRRISDISGTLSGTSKMIRSMVQSGVLALGAWLVINGELSGGMILASNVLVGRALAPAEQVIANWRNLLAARQGWQRLKDLFALFPNEEPTTSLPAPNATLTVEGMFAAPPGEQRMTVQNVSLKANAGSVIGVIGPSASGKSSFVRALVGVWKLRRGQVRLDGASLDQWPAADRGRHIGYMPQISDLFPGTIAENIARLDPDADDGAIIAAGKAAGAHAMIVSFPKGYETEVGDGGANLSAGQRQRVALARALYGDPFLVVLDEPNANLDLDGDKALADAILSVKDRGGIVIVVAHRNSVLSLLDHLMVMEEGAAKAFGPRDAVLKTLAQQRQRPQRSASVPVLTVIEGEGA
ncbi:type I secretion system permease/ATPase [Mesorhizobium sp. B2-5-9]|uniref:type I secretion system permease/ATPase n=1 Tax=Mesorhizobium sp. B2-5-9 TaxID=2589921 RepID=UPI00112CADCD|nr:type I secretion system permease/ATPase [Mesorhizobium sp. B2-5-9]TPJ95438.1 type I secretion system permease/ATPase [Mesorhizobium sp. B2-5-9]